MDCAGMTDQVASWSHLVRVDACPQAALTRAAAVALGAGWVDLSSVPDGHG
jgi:hypothetical protein